MKKDCLSYFTIILFIIFSAKEANAANTKDTIEINDGLFVSAGAGAILTNHDWPFSPGASILLGLEYFPSDNSLISFELMNFNWYAAKDNNKHADRNYWKLNDEYYSGIIHSLSLKVNSMKLSDSENIGMAFHLGMALTVQNRFYGAVDLGIELVYRLSDSKLIGLSYRAIDNVSLDFNVGGSSLNSADKEWPQFLYIYIKFKI